MYSPISMKIFLVSEARNDHHHSPSFELSKFQSLKTRAGWKFKQSLTLFLNYPLHPTYLLFYSTSPHSARKVIHTSTQKKAQETGPFYKKIIKRSYRYSSSPTRAKGVSSTKSLRTSFLFMAWGRSARGFVFSLFSLFRFIVISPFVAIARSSFF